MRCRVTFMVFIGGMAGLVRLGPRPVRVIRLGDCRRHSFAQGGRGAQGRP